MTSLRPSKAQVFMGAGVLLGLWLLFITCFYSLEPTEFGISRNMLTGTVSQQSRTGYHMKPPWVFVSVIDTRPTRVCLTSSAHAAFNCRLVRFVGSEWRAFVRTEGFRLYWWSNRLSFNSGYREEYRGMKDIMRGYAFSTEHYPFLEIIREYQTQ